MDGRGFLQTADRAPLVGGMGLVRLAGAQIRVGGEPRSGVRTAASVKKEAARGRWTVRAVTPWAMSPISMAQLSHPPLTTIRQPVDELTTRATEMLLARIDEPDRQPDQVFLPTSLVRRGSTDPAAEDPA
ncbi:substrate-binding domain-containing protein [Streptomyces sp. NPDC051018]|uniref:substrate-binding domain-containing protein n=1 Tax=Streptomyces sp. NPDC051018 TaxID=3365639 RepID=UPI003794B926